MSNNKDTSGRLLQTDAAAAYLGIARRTLQELVQNRKVSFIKIGRSIRFDPADLDTFIESRRVRARGWKQTKQTATH